VRFVAVHAYGDAQPLTPRAFGQFLDFALAAMKGPFAVLAVQQKTFEVAEAIEDETRDLARENNAFLRLR
jgi:hypothetical protein